MTEPISSAVVGIKITPAIAGAIGAISSMRSVANLRWYERLFAMINGAGAAAYLSPAISKYFSLDATGEHAVAYLTGIVALNLTSGIFEVSRKFAGDPLGTVAALLRLRRGEPPKDDQNDR